MTRCNSRSYLPRTPHLSSNKRPTIRNDTVYNIRSLLLLCFLLSLLPQKPSPKSRNRSYLTSYRNKPAKPIPSTPIKNSSPTIFGRNNNLSTSQNNRKKPQRSDTSLRPNGSLRGLLHRSTSMRIPRRTIYYSR